MSTRKETVSDVIEYLGSLSGALQQAGLGAQAQGVEDVTTYLKSFASPLSPAKFVAHRVKTAFEGIEGGAEARKGRQVALEVLEAYANNRERVDAAVFRAMRAHRQACARQSVAR